MSYPKKAKGWRILTLNNRQFRWKLVVEAENSLLKLQGVRSSGQQAIATLVNWHDPWLSLEKSPNEPVLVTSKLASRAIQFALENNWEPDEPGPPLHFEFKESSFALSK